MTLDCKPPFSAVAAVTICVVFLLGMVVLPFLPETKGKPSPEE